MEIFERRAEMARWSAECRAQGSTVGFVPTMGALHAGHISLYHQAGAGCDRVVGSIFVNPTQFGPGEDFQRYPRTLDRDRALLEAAGVDALYLPDVGEIYPDGAENAQTTVTVGSLAADLCGAARPGHFQGVATVVAILFNQVAPHRAYFGLKDYQQFLVIRRMARDLAMPVEVIGLETVREPDGLAMSSRNRYLEADDRQRALALSRAMATAQEAYAGGENDPAALEGLARGVLTRAGIERIDYVAVRDAETLEPLGALPGSSALQGRDSVILLAAHVGAARLIDNRRLVRL